MRFMDVVEKDMHRVGVIEEDSRYSVRWRQSLNRPARKRRTKKGFKHEFLIKLP